MEKKHYLQLPAEIRCQIYDAAFRQIPHCFYQRDGRRHIMSDDHLKLPALCQVNRQIYSESLALFYGTSDCHIQLWPKSLDHDGPDLTWLGPPDSSRMRMFGRVKITSEAFTLVISQQEKGSSLKLEQLRFYGCSLAVGFNQMRDEVEKALSFIGASENGFTPRLLKQLLHFMLYYAAEWSGTFGAARLGQYELEYDALDFLSDRAKLEKRHREAAKDLLSLSPTKVGLV